MASTSVRVFAVAPAIVGTFAVILATFLLAPVAHASSFRMIDFAVPGGVSGCLSASTSSTTGPVTLSQDCSFFHIGGPHTASASSTAGFSAIETDLSLTLLPQMFQTSAHSGTVQSESRGDYVFSGPASTVTYSVNLDFQAQLQFMPCQDSSCFLSTRAWGNDFDVTVTAQNEGLTFSQDIIGISQIVATGTPIEILIRMTAFGVVSNQGFGNPLSASSVNSLTLNLDGPVFNLPDGFTADGPCVENNQYVCDSAAVPEASSLALFAVGLLGLVAASRFRVRWLPRTTPGPDMSAVAENRVGLDCRDADASSSLRA